MRQLMFLVAEIGVLHLLLGEIQHSLEIRDFLHRLVLSAFLSSVLECLLGSCWEQGMVADGDFRDLSSSRKRNGSGCFQIGEKENY